MFRLKRQHCWCASEHGECTKNSGYMEGGPGSVGNCRKACGKCTPCPEGDKECLELARSSQGFLTTSKDELEAMFGIPVDSEQEDDQVVV